MKIRNGTYQLEKAMLESSIHILTDHLWKRTFEILIEMEFIAEELQIGLPEKVIICLSWFLIETVGNGMLIVLIRFDILAGDPLKRRITDQVRLDTKS